MCFKLHSSPLIKVYSYWQTYQMYKPGNTFINFFPSKQNSESVQLEIKQWKCFSLSLANTSVYVRINHELTFLICNFIYNINNVIRNMNVIAQSMSQYIGNQPILSSQPNYIYNYTETHHIWNHQRFIVHSNVYDSTK